MASALGFGTEPPNKERTWFKQKPYVLTTAALLIFYSALAAKYQSAFVWIDKFVTPVVSALHFIGLGVIKPFMDGPMPAHFYANMVGIGVWGVVVYSLRAVWWYVKSKGRIADRSKTWELVRKEKGEAGFRGLLAGSFFVCIFIAVYCPLLLLNGIHGWVVLHVHDFITPVILVMAWVFPGVLIIPIWWTLIWYAGMALLKFYRLLFK